MVRTITIGTVAAAVLLMSGCSSDKATSDETLVAPEHKPTATFKQAKPSDIASEFEGKVDSTASKIEAAVGDLNLTTIENWFDFHDNEAQNGKVIGDAVNPCITDKITETNTSINGTLTFNQCSEGDVSVNGKLYVHANWSEEEKTYSYTAGTDGDITITGNGVKITISKAQTEGHGSEEESVNYFGISANIHDTDTDKDILVLDGINTNTTLKKGTSDNMDLYTFSINGNFGDHDGLFALKTLQPMKGSYKKGCPDEGKLTITDANSKTLALTFKGSNQMDATFNGETDTVNCNEE